MPYGANVKRAPFRGPKQEVEVLADWSGGLNFRADAFQLAENETPLIEELDINPDGGVQSRGAHVLVNTTEFANAQHSIFAFQNSTGTAQFLVGHGTKTAYSTGGAFTDTGTTWTVSDRQEAANFNDNLYIQNGTDPPRKWTGSGISNLTQTFNDTLGSPNSGDMLIAYHLAVWRNHMWLANTREGGTQFKNRVRFSHPNEVEDYRTNDWFDVEKGREGDSIQALVPYKDRLLVFKQKSMHAVVGSSAANFSQTAISYKHGVCGPDAIATDGDYVYFFSWPEGVFRYDGSKIEWLWHNIYPKVLDGTIPDAAQAKIALGWMRRRLWVSVPWSGSSINARTFVWDPNLGGARKGQRSGLRQGAGAWTQYTRGWMAFLDWRPLAATQIPLALFADTAVRKRVYKLEQSQDTDNLNSDAILIRGRVQTRWIMGDIPSRKKRFKRVDFVVDNDKKMKWKVTVRRDYDPLTVTKEFFYENEPILTAGTWGQNWGSMIWGSGASGSQKIIRSAPVGSGRTVQLDIVQDPATEAANPNKWGINAIVFKYIPKTLR